jgi:hypothetical protein
MDGVRWVKIIGLNYTGAVLTPISYAPLVPHRWPLPGRYPLYSAPHRSLTHPRATHYSAPLLRDSRPPSSRQDHSHDGPGATANPEWTIHCCHSVGLNRGKPLARMCPLPKPPSSTPGKRPSSFGSPRNSNPRIGLSFPLAAELPRP